MINYQFEKRFIRTINRP